MGLLEEAKLRQKGDRNENVKHRRNHRICIPGLSEFRVRAG